jgi:N-acyl-D-aspartate/D-glutamate deacylase
MDVGILGDRIEALADLADASAGREIDAKGLVVAPGFIDSHTHSDLLPFMSEEHVNVAMGNVRQGVTTEVVGNCGFSPFPSTVAHRQAVGDHLSGLFGRADLVWPDFHSYVLELERVGLCSNFAPLVGHGTLRASVLGFENRTATSEEMAMMERLAQASFEEGAIGLSSGLVYPPGIYAPKSELVRLAKVAASFRRPYVTHLRSETDGVAEALSEAIATTIAANASLHVSHHKVAGRANWGRIGETLGLIDRARHDGLDVSTDMYPYTAGSTLLYSLLPPWILEGGVSAGLQLLRELSVRKRIASEFETGISGWQNLLAAGGWTGTMVASCPGETEVEGRSLSDLAEDQGLSPTDYMCELLIRRSGKVIVISHLMAEEDVTNVLMHEAAMVGSDGIPLPGKPHPRWTGSFTRVLGRYRREQNLLDLPEWIRKMTSLPSKRFGLKDRGVLKRGGFADVVVFDPATVLDRSTYEQPLQGPVGIYEVIVNGLDAVKQGIPTGIRAGRVLTRPEGY